MARAPFRTLLQERRKGLTLTVEVATNHGEATVGPTSSRCYNDLSIYLLKTFTMLEMDHASLLSFAHLLSLCYCNPSILLN